MRRNVRRLNREVGSLNANLSGAKRKAPSTSAKGSKRGKEKEITASEDAAAVEIDELAMQMMGHGTPSIVCSTFNGVYLSLIYLMVLQNIRNYEHSLSTHFIEFLTSD